MELEQGHCAALDEMTGGCGACQRAALLAEGLTRTSQRRSGHPRLRGAGTHSGRPDVRRQEAHSSVSDSQNVARTLNHASRAAGRGIKQVTLRGHFEEAGSEGTDPECGRPEHSAPGGGGGAARVTASERPGGGGGPCVGLFAS